MVVTTTASVSNLVWGKDPEEIRKLLEKQITELGASKEVSAAFFKNNVMTPTHWVRTVTALYAVKAKGSADYIDTAADAKSEREAVFLSESAVMLQKLHAESPVEAILTDTRIMIAKTKDGRAIALLPGDYLPWTEKLAHGSKELGERVRTELGAKSAEIWIQGGVSPRARQELKTLGWACARRPSRGELDERRSSRSQIQHHPAFDPALAHARRRVVGLPQTLFWLVFIPHSSRSRHEPKASRRSTRGRRGSVGPGPLRDLRAVGAVLVGVAHVVDDGVLHLFLQVRGRACAASARDR